MQIQKCGKWDGCGGSNAVYGLGMIGALVYFWQLAPDFSGKLLAILKALVWPALAVYELLKFLQV